MGIFLRSIQPHCSAVLGIEKQKNYVNQLNCDGIPCVLELQEIKDRSLDVVVSYHVIEHLPDPIRTLKELNRKIVSGGKIIIEVPHAKDYLLTTLHCSAFKEFTLWSQHLLLHTRASLTKFLQEAGFTDVLIHGAQKDIPYLII